MAYVNLWELITTIASKKRDLPNQEACEAIQLAAGNVQAFASELSLDIGSDGSWTIKLFCHEGSDRYISLRVLPSGRITVTRHDCINDDLTDLRTISF